MRYFFIILICYFSPVLAQEDSVKVEISDSLNKFEYLDTLDIRIFGSLRICYGSMYLCDGIINGSDTYVKPNTDSVLIRAIITHEHDSIFRVKYRRNEKSEFKTGYYKVFSLNKRGALAIPEDNVYLNLSSQELNNPWNYIPASSDGREVLYSYYENNKIIYYEFKE